MATGSTRTLSRAPVHARRPIAVVDIGSNSVRLVVFEGLRRVALPLFNEKVQCGLGRGLAASGQLNEEGVALAIETLRRFKGLVSAMGVRKTGLLATAAVRDAGNGKAFVQEIEAAWKQKVSVLSGREEAHYSAQGVFAGNAEAQGLMGDLGGGSLELVELKKGNMGQGTTLPLGPLRLPYDLSEPSSVLSAHIDSELDQQDWLERIEERDFFLVGGAWRSFAKLHMEQSNYPLHMVHGYTIDRQEALDLSALVAQQARSSLAAITSVSKRRLETLPYASLLLNRLLTRLPAERLVLSAFGLREGWIFDQLSESERTTDPLIDAAHHWAEADARFGDLGDNMDRWAAPLFIDESPKARRLRKVVCLLSDIGWRYHPDYRAEQMMLRILRAQELYLLHDERAFIALSLYVRYRGRADSGAKPAASLLSIEEQKRAKVLGLAIRVAISLSGGTKGILDSSSLRYAENEVTLAVPDDLSVPVGQVLERRLGQLAEALEASDFKVLR